MIKQVFKTMVAFLAVATMTIGPVRGQNSYNVTFSGFNYPELNTTVNVASLPQTFTSNFNPPSVIDDVCYGFTNAYVTSGGEGNVSASVVTFSEMSITVSGTFEGTATIHVTGKDDEERDISTDVYVSCVAAGGGSEPEAQSGYSVTLVDTVDAAHWQGKVGENGSFQAFPLEELNEGTTVYVKYTGSRKVKDVVATVTYPEGAVSLATPLTIEAITAGTIVVNRPKEGMKYTLNGGEKQAVSGDPANITVAAGDKVAFYGDGTNITVYDGTEILGSGDGFTCKVYGNIMSLVDENNYETATTLPSAQYVFYFLFSGNTSLTDASQLLLPATTLANSCYTGMFQGCENLTAGPAELPATTLTNQCYYGMFNGCSGLTAAPALPATTLAQSCYAYMFSGCLALTTAPDTLPATTLANACYRGMFQNCTTLVAAPALPATTLVNNCYNNMFRGCASLTTAPELPAPELVSYCYNGMFNGCNNLSSVTCLATSGINASSSTSYWLQNAGSNVTGTKTFTAATSATWPSGNNGIPSGWTRVNQ